MVTHISQSLEETIALGEAWGKTLAPGTVIGLSGELGAGKTQLVKGIALGLGCPGRVHSPTFTLLNHYGGGRLPLYHLDLYRLAGADEVRAAGLEEYFFRGDIVTVVEWIERMDSAIPPPPGAFTFRRTRIEILSGESRKITY